MENMKIEFECYEDGRWYVIMPEYAGPQEDLEMVEGADKMLDAITSDGKMAALEVCLDEPIDGDYITLEMEAHDDYGAHYVVKNCELYKGTIWLCNVAHEFFGDHPQTIFCSIIDQ